MNLTLNKKFAAKKVLLERFFGLFVRWNFLKMMRRPFLWNAHHDILAEALEKVLNGKIKRLIINIPPRYSKTEMVKQFCANGFARNPESNFIYTSYSDTLALKTSKEVKDAIQTPDFVKFWPIKIKQDTRSKKLWETEVGGSFFATSVGGQVTGFGAGQIENYKSKTTYRFNGALIIDDPIKVQDRHSAVVRAEVIDYYENTLKSRLNSCKNTPIILIMQRVHPEDLAGYIIENEPEEWTVLKLPAIKEDGTVLWEAKHSIEDLRKMEKVSEMFSGQYQQEPIKLGGNLIKPSLFKLYFELPYLRKRYITVDTATKDKEHNDYSVFQCWGLGHDNLFYLIDQVRGKFLYGELKTRFIAFWNKHLHALNEDQYGYLTCAYVEDKSSGTQLIQEAVAEGKIAIQPIQRNRSKLERVIDILLPKMEAGFVCLPAEAEFLSDFYKECEDFHPSMSHKHDDQIDAATDGVEIGSKDIFNNSNSADLVRKNLQSSLSRRMSKRKRRMSKRKRR